jgi:hypothetical protein
MSTVDETMSTMTKHSIAQRRNPLNFLLTQSQQVAAMLTMGLYFQYFVYRTERLMDSYLREHTFLQQLRDSVAPSPEEVKSRYLVFQKTPQGQGIGNIMNGLLAAHMLGLEFNRTVCVANDWDEFHKAFHIIRHQDECRALSPKGAMKDRIMLINFEPPPNECRLQSRLASETPVLYLVANTYPRWSITPRGLWDEHYEPTERLIHTLPYRKRPSTVVHLRQPDGEFDERTGLDEPSLQALALKLPNDTFLVTNNVQWYKFFENYGWRNPGWHKVRHSAIASVEWASGDKPVANQTESPDDANMQLWSDWYTILRADHVYHTHSDFSLSAIHWNEINSKTIKGIMPESGELEFSDEAWRVDEPMPRLVDRTGDELKNCDKVTDDMGGLALADDDQSVTDDIHPFHDNNTDGKGNNSEDIEPGLGESLRTSQNQDPNQEKAQWNVPGAFLRKEKPPDWIDDVVADAQSTE